MLKVSSKRYNLVPQKLGCCGRRDEARRGGDECVDRDSEQLRTMPYNGLRTVRSSST